MISVIIPTLNAESTIAELLRALYQQTVQFEVLLIDSSSSDNTLRIAESFGVKTTTILTSNFQHGLTRNRCARLGSGDILVFLTQDALPCDRDCLETLVLPLKDPKIAASYGRQIPDPNVSPVEQFTRIFNYPEESVVKDVDDLPRLGIKTFFFSNVCSAIKAKEFNELGCFPENIVMFEDLIFAAKAILKGYKIAYVPDAKVWHSHNFSLIQQFRRYRDAGVSLRNNSWIFEHTTANSEGVKFLKQLVRYLSREHQYHWIPYAITESIFKFSGFWLGIHGINSYKNVFAPPRPIRNA